MANQIRGRMGNGKGCFRAIRWQRKLERSGSRRIDAAGIEEWNVYAYAEATNDPCKTSPADLRTCGLGSDAQAEGLAPADWLPIGLLRGCCRSSLEGATPKALWKSRLKLVRLR